MSADSTSAAPPHPSSPDDERATALKLWVVLARAYASIARHSVADVARHGLTPAEFGVLEALHHHGPMLLGELGGRVLVSSGGTTFVVDRLAAKGLVERRDCPEDRRARYAALTKAGERLISAIFPVHAEAIERALGGLSPTTQRDATVLLRALGRHAAALPLPGEGAAGEPAPEAKGTAARSGRTRRQRG
ncbi:MAG TPA: MarR family transcriptional regulator [Gemmatimonadaceae bacterium]|nr:MarR family transcriptional regulator [Gemmatimonadaceae bacterium]